jgi:hypothetical protein
MRTKNNATHLPVAQPAIRDFNAVLGTVFSASTLLTAFESLAFHMMVTFYFLLIIVAMVVGKEGKCPSLMTFVLVWHLFALPTLILRSFTVRMCKKPYGMLICFAVIAILFFVLQPYLITAMINIKSWIKDALVEMTRF